MNNIFEKNIAALAQKDRNLAVKLNAFIPDTLPQLAQTGNAYNFLYKGVFLHNEQSPLGEAQAIFNNAENNPSAIHLVYGLGLGYLFQYVSLNSMGTVILYEPDLNIMKMAFSLVDFSGDILKQNVFITDNLSQAEEYIYQKSNTKNIPLLLSTTAYQELNKDLFNKMVLELQEMVGRFSLDLKFTQEKFYPLLMQTLYNIPKLVKETPLVKIKDFYKGKTAVVVSAGPTLDRNIETIKKYRENIILIVVGTALKTVVLNGLKPDFLCIIESFDSAKQMAGIDLSDVNFVTEPFSHPNLRIPKFKKTYSHISSNMPINNFWSEVTGEDISEYLSKGTVSYTALNTARIIGCSKIVLVGQDLAYIEGQCYSKDSAYKDLKCLFNSDKNKWEITAENLEDFANSLSNSPNRDERIAVAYERLNNLNASLYYVKGINGEMIPTESVYAAFIQPLTEFTKLYPNVEYINTSLVGAQIDGFENIPLEEALKNAEKIDNREISTDFNYDINMIKDNLFKEKKLMESAGLIIEEVMKTAKNLNNDLRRYRNVTVEILKDLKKLAVGYSSLSDDYTKKSMLFDFITTANRIDLNYEMKMTREFNEQNISSISDKILKYCEDTELKIKEVGNKINEIIGFLETV